jgi:hypothetical protein
MDEQNAMPIAGWETPTEPPEQQRLQRPTTTSAVRKQTGSRYIPTFQQTPAPRIAIAIR